MENKKSTIVEELVKIFSDHDKYQKMIQFSNKTYQIHLYKINKFEPSQIIAMYNGITLKSYGHPQLYSQEFWFENQLKVFIWTLVAFSFHRQLLIQNFTQDEWLLFSHSFNHRPIDFFHFQAKFIIKPQRLSKAWTKEEQQLLKSIIIKDQILNKWNLVARQLFKLSNKIYYKTPKQCRQRWLNHLDPLKKHTPWTITQDIELFNCVKSIGKKWAQISKIFKNTRTQHMIKNRYKAILYSYTKKYQKIKEQQVVEKFLKFHETQKPVSNNDKAQKTIKQRPKKAKSDIIKNIRTSPRRRTNVIQFTDSKKSNTCNQQKLSINIDVQVDMQGPIEESTINKETKLTVEQKIFSGIIEIQHNGPNEFQFFEELDSKMSNIPFLMQNQQIDSFISRCIQVPVVDYFIDERMEGQNISYGLIQ